MWWDHCSVPSCDPGAKRTSVLRGREGRTRAPSLPSSRATSLTPESPRASGRFSLFGRWKHKLNFKKVDPPPPAAAPANDPPPPPPAPQGGEAVPAPDTRSLDTAAAQTSLASNAAPALGANATGIDGVPLVHSPGETPSWPSFSWEQHIIYH
jgi:hypothetical protein